jgi:hypothetical protein
VRYSASVGCLSRSWTYQDAIAQYAHVTAITPWASGDRQKYLEDAYLNQACCYSLPATADTTDAAYTIALADLA